MLIATLGIDVDRFLLRAFACSKHKRIKKSEGHIYNSYLHVLSGHISLTQTRDNKQIHQIGINNYLSPFCMVTNG